MDTSVKSVTSNNNSIVPFEIGSVNGHSLIGMLDINGKSYIPKGRSQLFSISGEIDALSASASDHAGFDYAVNIAPQKSTLSIPDKFGLSQNCPNPFNPITSIDFSIPVPSNVRLDIFNITGSKVATLIEGRLEAGQHRVSWDSKGSDGRPLASGIYFYRLKAGEFTDTKKMMLLK
jgi:flagellar hook assembly protein FlgD